MSYGYFDDKKREYVITNPRTPTKWINYIGTLAFGGFVDHTGGALICAQDPALNRITKYITQFPASAFNGETLYLRTAQKQRGKITGYRIFSPFFVPSLDQYDRYECHVGLGYTRIVSEFHGLRTEATIFVPIGERREIRDIKITNISKKPIEVDAIPVVEYTHPDALKQLTNADWVPQTMQSRMLQDARYTILIQYPFMLRDMRVNYFTSNLPASSFETDRQKFLGENGYGTWAHPIGLESPELSCTEALRGDNLAALLHQLGVLLPGKSKRFITQLGQVDHLENELAAIAKYRQPREVDRALAEIKAFWDEYLSKLQCDTPDADFNRMINVHNARQCYITKQWSRYLSLYQLGYGARGIGTRDSSQDVMAVLASVPDEGRALIKQLLSVQRRNGSAYHQFNPLSLIASEGDAVEREDRPHYYSDDHLWSVLVVGAYLKETGQRAFLDEVIPYYEKDKQEQPLESGTVLDHLKRAIEFTHGDVGRHGLPHLGFADWNDTINLATGAESLFSAHLYGRALQEMIALSEYLGEAASAQKYVAYYEEMKACVNEHAWDGEWYVGYFDHDGTPLGSQQNKYGQIQLNGQTWAVISGFATPDRAVQALASAHRLLNTRNGLKVSWPGFNGFDPAYGGVTTYPPGAKENGGIFLHTNPWAVMANAIVGNGDRAYEYYRQINPASKNDCIDEFEVEPYVYPQNILGDEHPQFGLGRNSWLSGTASWMYQAGTQYILGVRPAYTGLLIDPCIPHDWPGFKVTRQVRGATYIVEVRNPERVSKGVKSIEVDGTPHRGNIVPYFDDKQTHRVVVVMGG
ncbi:cellobiose phosphorylase [Thermoflexales bacterium]|nr:cellobiose phosphorylase [Thermoflexales bacterium]